MKAPGDSFSSVMDTEITSQVGYKRWINFALICLATLTQGMIAIGNNTKYKKTRFTNVILLVCWNVYTYLFEKPNVSQTILGAF